MSLPFFSASRSANDVLVQVDSDGAGEPECRSGSKGALGPVDGSRGMIDAVHHAANRARMRSLAAAQEMLTEARIHQDPRFFAALEAVLEVLPVSKAFTGIELEGDAAPSGSDFETLYNLARLAYRDEIDEPAQLKLWQDDAI